MTERDKRRLATAALCGVGAVLLLHPLYLAAFAAGAWAGCRGRDWLRRFWSDREAME